MGSPPTDPVFSGGGEAKWVQNGINRLRGVPSAPTYLLTSHPSCPQTGLSSPSKHHTFPYSALSQKILPSSHVKTSISDSYKLSLHETVSLNKLFLFPLHPTIPARAKPSLFIDQPTVKKGPENLMHPLKAGETRSPIGCAQFNYSPLKHYIP